MNNFEDKHKSFDEMIKRLIELLPSSYNKEVTDTNYYKLLRSVALQLADAKIEIEEIGLNRYLDTATTAQSIYDNFGTLVKLEKNPDWDVEKYRSLIKGVIQSLLKGPNKESMSEGFKLFTNFKTNIYELYRDSDKIDKAAYVGYNPKYTFALEIEKPVDSYVDQDILLRDANYVINIIKPAHTLSINIITIVGDENYRRYYRIDRKLGNIIENCTNRKIESRINQKLKVRFDDEARDYSELNSISFEEAQERLREMSSGMSIADYESAVEKLAQEKLDLYLTSVTDCDVVIYTIENYRIDVRSELRGSLELKWLQEDKDQVFKEETIDLTKEQVNEIVENKKDKLVSYCENDEFCNPFDKTEVEWFKEALIEVKNDYYRERILEELGGADKVKVDCTAYAENFRSLLEKAYIANPPYCGMDKMLSEASLNSNEGIYGWKHHNYQTQFITSIDNSSTIGGSRLIGPRYTLYDYSHSESHHPHEDIRTKPFEDEFEGWGVELEDTMPEATSNLEEIEIDFQEFIPETLEERSIYFEQTLDEKVIFAFHYKDFTLEKSKLSEDDLLIAYDPEHTEHFEIEGEGFSEMLPPIFEDFLMTTELVPFEHYDTINEVEDISSFGQQSEYEEIVNFCNRYDEFTLSSSELNGENRLFGNSGDKYEINIHLNEEKYSLKDDETSCKMYKIVDNIEVEIESRII